MVLNTKVQGNWWPMFEDKLVNITRFWTYPHCPYRDEISYDAPAITVTMAGAPQQKPYLQLSGFRIFLGEPTDEFFEEGCTYRIWVDKCSVHTT